MPSAPPTASTPARPSASAGVAATARTATSDGPTTKTSSVAVASRAKAVGRTRTSTRDHSARTVPDTSGVAMPVSPEAAITARVGAPPRTTATRRASSRG
jgi:hypothetical protein